MKKVVWAGFLIQMFMLMIIFLFIFLHQPIPDFVMIIFAGGMLTCIIFSIFTEKETGKKELYPRR